MKARTIGRHVRESVKNLGRNGLMSFASISAVTVTLILVGVFLVIMMNLNHVAETIKENVEIRVHIDVTATPENQQALKKKIEQITEVSSVTFSPKEEELDNLILSFGEEGGVFELLEQDNPLDDIFVVKTTNPQDTITVAQGIEKFNFVGNVRYGQGMIENLFGFLNVSRNVGIGLIIGLLFTAMFLISNTIKITIIARKREIEIMRLVGATNSFIRWPFFLEGLLLGVLGSVIPIGIVYVGYQYTYDLIMPKLEGHFIQLLSMEPFIYQVSGILIGLGALIGVWGSMMSVRKFLKI